MHALDFSPLFRSTVGFDRLSKMLESNLSADQGLSYPPYNIVKVDDDNYRITMAVAGFADGDIDITAKENQLIVTGNATQRDENKDVTFLHRGIAERAFERRFQLADHIRVTGAGLDNGLLSIELVREIPETMKPRKIDIKAGAGKTLDQNSGDKKAS
ncbi:MAG: Hsp20 family protein [Micavibrio sp.]|nr:Hsp20 family protein [Micavibrio sp.]